MHPHIPEGNRRMQARALGDAQYMDVFTRLQLASELIAANKQMRIEEHKRKEEAETKGCFQPTTCAKSRRIVERLAMSHSEHAQTMWSESYARLYKDHFDRERRHDQRRLRESRRLTFAPALDARSRRIVAGRDEDVGRYKAALWGQVALLKQVIGSGKGSVDAKEEGKQKRVVGAAGQRKGKKAKLGKDSNGAPEIDFSSHIPEAFFRTPSGQAYGERLCGLLREQLQQLLRKLEQERRRLNLQVDVFLDRCEAYSATVPGDAVSVLVM